MLIPFPLSFRMLSFSVQILQKLTAETAARRCSDSARQRITISIFFCLRSTLSTSQPHGSDETTHITRFPECERLKCTCGQSGR